MNGFQIVVLPIITILFIERVVALLRGRGLRRSALFWAAIWLAAGVAIAWPGLTSSIARMSGVNRGADLVFYFAILFMFAGFFMSYLRMRRLESEITQLVRHIALTNPQRPGGSVSGVKDDHA